MSRLSKLREFVDTPLRYYWLNLVFSAAIAIEPAQPWSYYPSEFLATLIVMTCIYSPMQLCYQHLPDRVGITSPFSLRAIPLHLIVIFGWVLLGSEIGVFLASPFKAPDPEWPLLMRMINLFAAPLGVLGAISYETFRDRLEEARTREIRAQRQALSAQVQALQARIQPHFLFNSLNAVASLIGEDPRRAETAVEKLSDLFRYALDASSQPFVPLSEELASVEGFLELETLRFPDRLKTVLHVEPGIGNVPVPPLFLQPIVENAVAHGVAPRIEGGRIEVGIRRGEGVLCAHVEDDGPGPGSSSHRGAGTALADLRERLDLLYGDEAKLEVSAGPLGGCRVDVRLPLRPRELPGEESA